MNRESAIYKIYDSDEHDEVEDNEKSKQIGNQMNGIQLNTLYLGYNINILQDWYSRGICNFIDLVYNDVPYNSKKDYNVICNPITDTTEKAYNDTWHNRQYRDIFNDFANIDVNFYEYLRDYNKILPNESLRSYITIIGITNWYIHKMIKPTGSFYHQCDQNTSHYIKPVLDRIYGIENFRNNIIWCYTTGGCGRKIFPKKHDDILFYTKSDIYTYTPQREKRQSRAIDLAIKKGDEIFEDEFGKYTWGNRPGVNPKYPNGTKCYLDLIVRDWWTDIKVVHSQSKERKYPTQKPIELVDRIINSSSNPGDLVADFFMGGGTSIISAINNDRKFIGVDVNISAISIAIDRINSLKKLVLKKNYFVLGIPNSSIELKQLITNNIYGDSEKSSIEGIVIKYYLRQMNVHEVDDENIKSRGIDGKFSYKYKGSPYIGLIRIIENGSLNDFKLFCLEVLKQNNYIGVYITFNNQEIDKIKQEAILHGKLNNVDKLQILTIEDLIDNNKIFNIPRDVLTI